MSENVFDKISGIPVASGFKLQAKAPLDPRQVVDTIEDRNALITENGAYEGMQVYVKADKKTYCLKDLIAGTWEEFGTGGGSTAQYEEFTFTSFSNYQEVTGTPTYYQIDFNSADLESYIEFFTRNYEKGLTLSVILDGVEVMQFPLSLKSDMYWGSAIVSYADIIGLTVFGNYGSLQLRGFSIYDNIENVILIKEVFQGLVLGMFQLKIRTAVVGSSVNAFNVSSFTITSSDITDTTSTVNDTTFYALTDDCKTRLLSWFNAIDFMKIISATSVRCITSTAGYGTNLPVRMINQGSIQTIETVNDSASHLINVNAGTIQGELALLIKAQANAVFSLKVISEV